MKHTLRVTILLICIFIISQVTGLFLVNKDIQSVTPMTDNATNETVLILEHGDTAIGPRPETKGVESLFFILIGVTIGTALVLLIIKYGKINIWKTWFFVAVWIAIMIALGVIFNKTAALIIALGLAALKIFRRSFIIHNLTEVLMYAGIAVLLVPMLNVALAIILLIIISIYDMIAVWQSKHMVKMAKFQTKSKMFAGLMIPYTRPSGKIKKTKTTKTTKVITMNAFLGGGDIAFPLIFSGTVMEWMIVKGIDMSTALWQANIITITAAIGLSLLFAFAKKDRFYPAMPFLTAACLVGYGIILLI